MDPVKLQKEFDKNREAASGIAAVVVEAEERVQAGQKYLAGECPRCQTPMNLSGEGKQLCRKCHLWLEYRRVV